jgi:multiple sugar transport system permease protein
VARTAVAVQPDAVSVARRGTGLQPRGTLDRWIFLGPAVLLVLALSVFPFVFSIGLMFASWDFARLEGAIEFNGLNNFVRLFNDARFLSTMRNTLIYVFVGVPLQYLVALGLALLVHEELPGRRFFRICFMLPLMISPVAVGFGVGRVMFDESRGPLNELLLSLGLSRVPWVSNPDLAVVTILLLETWQLVPFTFLILLAGLQALPQEPYEAAQIDGASTWQCFRYITFPLLLPITITVLFIRGLDVFKIIDVIAVVTGGGPGSATESITLYAAQIGLKNMDMGYAATVAWGLMAVVIAFAVVYLKAVRRRIPEI